MCVAEGRTTSIYLGDGLFCCAWSLQSGLGWDVPSHQGLGKLHFLLSDFMAEHPFPGPPSVHH